MKIALFTNTYLPFVSGVANSVIALEEACRKAGHEVVVVAPKFKNEDSTANVLRVPAIQKFNGSDFSVRIPVPHLIQPFIDDFRPDIIHSHHPFLMGDAALRVARKADVPLVFTHHTLYERYTHYVPMDSPALRRAAIQLATEFCLLCDQVIAPSESVEHLLRERGVDTPVLTVPTGIDLDLFSGGDRSRFRKKMAIPEDARVIGTVGRMGKEKNLVFLADAVARCLADHPEAVFLAVGEGDLREEIVSTLRNQAGESQVRAPGSLTGQDLSDAYAAMDWFVFASQTETQGIVLAEAMAAGKPVVALDGPGVREIVKDGRNGALLPSDAPANDFAHALAKFMDDDSLSLACAKEAGETVKEFAVDVCAKRVMDCYERLIQDHEQKSENRLDAWERLCADIETEWSLLSVKMKAIKAAFKETESTNTDLS